jgi:mono/diheme cytochrome c family protein
VQQYSHAMKSILGILVLCTALVGGARAAPASAASTSALARGKALVDAADCSGCHTADPAKPFAGGKSIATPFGSIFSSNLTPDAQTGIGAWRDEDFYRALHNGVAPDGGRYYPAFPYPHFTKITRDDVLAIRQWLETLAPVGSRRSPPQLRWPLNYRVVMRVWNFLFLRPGGFTADSTKSAARNRGAYLVEGAAHCGACHTPKNAFGAEKNDQLYAGAPIDGWFAPRLDGAERSGLKSWSVSDIAEYLQSGRNARSHAAGLMAQVVVNSTAKLSDDDVNAIAVYLKDLPAGASESAVAAPPAAQVAEGAAIYQGACIACHEADGSGSPRIYPPLPGNANLQSDDPSSTLRLILDGAETVITARAPNTGSMPAYRDKLSDQQVAAIATYVRNAWGNAASAVSPDQVMKARLAR